MSGFAMMSLFGLFLSLPLVVFAAVPGLGDWLARLAIRMKKAGWIMGLVFLLLCLWSIWFGLYVDPADWVGNLTLT